MLEHKGAIDIKTDRLLLRKFQTSDANRFLLHGQVMNVLQNIRVGMRIKV